MHLIPIVPTTMNPGDKEIEEIKKRQANWYQTAAEESNLHTLLCPPQIPGQHHTAAATAASSAATHPSQTQESQQQQQQQRQLHQPYIANTNLPRATMEPFATAAMSQFSSDNNDRFSAENKTNDLFHLFNQQQQGNNFNQHTQNFPFNQQTHAPTDNYWQPDVYGYGMNNANVASLAAATPLPLFSNATQDPYFGHLSSFYNANPTAPTNVSNIVQNFTNNFAAVTQGSSSHEKSGLAMDLNDQSSYSSYIEEPEPMDVILGRGRGNTKHPGNSYFIALCQQYSPQYLQECSTRSEKAKVVHLVVDKIVQSGGRFLKAVSTGAKEPTRYVKVHLSVAHTKACQALRYKYREPKPVREVSNEESLVDSAGRRLSTETLRANVRSASISLNDAAPESYHTKQQNLAEDKRIVELLELTEKQEEDERRKNEDSSFDVATLNPSDSSNEPILPDSDILRYIGYVVDKNTGEIAPVNAHVKPSGNDKNAAKD